MICHKHKFIFVHIAKCGGCSIHSIFKNHKRTGHNPLDQIKSKNKNVNRYFTFTVVRNPFDRILSAYMMWNQISLNHPWAQWDKKEIEFCHYHSFKEFVKFIQSGCSDRPHIKPYIGYYFDKPSDLDFIGKFENYQKDFKIFCDKIKIPHRVLPHANSTKHTHYSEYYDDETREIVAEKFAKDIEYFGYKFGE